MIKPTSGVRAEPVTGVRAETGSCDFHGIIIPFLQMRKLAQRNQVICPRSHNLEGADHKTKSHIFRLEIGPFIKHLQAIPQGKGLLTPRDGGEARVAGPGLGWGRGNGGLPWSCVLSPACTIQTQTPERGTECLTQGTECLTWRTERDG